MPCGQRSNLAPVLLVAVVIASGCFNPEDTPGATDGPTASTGESTTGTDTVTPTTTPSGTSPTTGSSTSSETDPATTIDPSDPGTGTEDDSTGPAIAECGNGTMEGDEECDDGDLRPGDGCSTACLDESIACDPGLAGALAGPELERLALSGTHLYGLRNTVPSELVVVDVSDPTNPSGAGALSIDEENYPNWNPGDLVASGDHLWTGGINPEFMSIDISSPTEPMFDYFAGPNESDGPIEILGNVLFAAHSVGEQLRVRDISDPSAPTPLPSIGNPSQVFRDVAAADDRVIAIAGPHLEIWDVSTPAVPMFEGELNGAPWSGSIRSAANGTTVVLATTGSGVGIVDYSLPGAPMVAATIPEESSPRDIALVGDFAYVPVTNGLRVYDVSNPEDPVLAGSYLEVEVYGVSVALSDSHVYLGTEGGLRVLEDMPGLCTARCGNNTVEYPESCDDGNTADGDGCSASCENE